MRHFWGEGVSECTVGPTATKFGAVTHEERVVFLCASTQTGGARPSAPTFETAYVFSHSMTQT